MKDQITSSIVHELCHMFSESFLEFGFFGSLRNNALNEAMTVILEDRIFFNLFHRQQASKTISHRYAGYVKVFKKSL